MSSITRRSALRRFGLVGAAAIGGGLGLLRPVHRKVPTPPPPPPDALVIALSDSRRLRAAYTNAIPRDPADTALITALRSDVEAHEQALLALLERYPGWRYEQSLPTPGPSASASPYPSPASRPAVAVGGDALRAALTAASGAAAAACEEWPAAEIHAAEAIGVLASISATLATHVQALS